MFAAFVLSFSLLTSVVLAGTNNQNGDNGSQGTDKLSQPLPDQSKVLPPAGALEDQFGLPHVVEGCRAKGGVTAVILGEASAFPPPYPQVSPWIVEGRACCASNTEMGTTAEGIIYHLPNQCCNPPDATGEYTPGNHCLCFANSNYAIVP